MANMEERLQAAVTKAETDANKWHTIIHGNDQTTVVTEGGTVPSVAKQLKDVRNELINGTADYVGQCETLKNETATLKSDTQTIKTETNTIKSETQTLRNEAESFKNQAQQTFNSISTATTAAVGLVQAEGTTQIALATAQAELAHQYALNAAPLPLGTKLTIPASSKIPDGYEPVWYKHSITRSRYPDFFTQLVDTNSLTLVDETTYDSQVSTYGMCASYVKVDNNTLILPLLVNFARGGTPSQLGGVELDQFQGHYHINQIRVDAYGSGDGATIGATNGTDEGLRQDGPDLYILNPKTGANGEVRFGDETRPKGYYELTYIKCADVTRTLTMEETSEIRNLATQLQSSVDTLRNAIQVTKTTTSWIEKNTITGLIKQGGCVTGSGAFNVSFLEVFPNKVISVFVSPYNQPTNTSTDTNYCTVPINITNSSFTIRYCDTDSTDSRSGSVSWMAIGY